MLCDDLRDLTMAGVRWELTELPMATIIANAAMAKAQTDAQNAPAKMQRTPTSVVPPIAPIIPMSVDTAVAMATRPADMDSLRRMIAEFNHPLRAGATNVVTPHVAKNPSGLVIVTDMPGSDDDASGTILGGAAGELLDKMIGAIGLSRDTVSIVPMLFWRTPGGRTPTREELDLARPFVNRAIELLTPRVVLTLGTTAAAEIANAPLPRGHGVVTDIAGGVKCVPIYHPNFLLLKPNAKRDAWTALQTVQNLLKSAEK